MQTLKKLFFTLILLIPFNTNTRFLFSPITNPLSPHDPLKSNKTAIIGWISVPQYNDHFLARKDPNTMYHAIYIQNFDDDLPQGLYLWKTSLYDFVKKETKIDDYTFLQRLHDNLFPYNPFLVLAGVQPLQWQIKNHIGDAKAGSHQYYFFKSIWRLVKDDHRYALVKGKLGAQPCGQLYEPEDFLHNVIDAHVAKARQHLQLLAQALQELNHASHRPR